jgi:hypothetical protein
VSFFVAFSMALAAFSLLFNELECTELLLVGFFLLLVALFLLLIWLLFYYCGTSWLQIVKTDTH